MDSFDTGFVMALGVILAICLLFLGAILAATFADARSYYQVRGVFHRGTWIYSIDKVLKFGKPDDDVDEENYLEVWFRSEEDAAMYLASLNQTSDEKV